MLMMFDWRVWKNYESKLVMVKVHVHVKCSFNPRIFVAGSNDEQKDLKRQRSHFTAMAACNMLIVAIETS